MANRHERRAEGRAQTPGTMATNAAAVTAGPGSADTPSYYASAAHVISNANDVMIVFSAICPTTSNDVTFTPAVAVSLSRGAATDLVEVLQGLLKTIEHDFGAINTPFLKERREMSK